ncbi:TolC family outer membrane protein [Curvibacter sp. APW13]|uniref:TolC family outer membrane protein n=1 Tax=Curvibacter sp. APW13 TaxID=3077236 RepID=UPI0028DEC896|nr:TolC family outer membrane protein [Curvibacter sp. APW13]MDT8991835.1 TolC family outer membrane protein [Curvibacter sp. APW13]
MFTTPSFRLLPLTLALGLAASAHAQSLSELYKAARSYDATYQSARSQFDATLAKAEQAKAALLPTVGLSASTNQYNTEAKEPTAKTYDWNDQKWSVSASQPLYRPANAASYDQGMQQVKLANAQLQAAEQDLMVRVGQAYFDALAARDSLALVGKQKEAVSEQLASAKRNFEVGTATITDTREAQARYDLVLAQEIAAENDLRVKTLALQQLVGSSTAAPVSLRDDASLPTSGSDSAEQWVGKALNGHPALQQLQVALDVAKLETKKAEAGHLPTLDLVGAYQYSASQGTLSSTTGKATNISSNTATVGLSFTLPLYAGNAITNRVRETAALQAKADTDLEASKRTISQGVRTAYFGVQSGLAQVKALEAAEASSQSALDANKLGYQVGVRINIDVLNSQSQLYDTKTKLAKARYDVLLGGLKLRQAAGVLQTDDLDSVSKLLAQ